MCVCHFVYKKMLHEYLRAFTVCNYRRLLIPPPRPCPAIFCELSAMLPHRQIQRMVLDFENATWRAARVLFPTVELKGCTFHFTQTKGYQGSNSVKN